MREGEIRYVNEGETTEERRMIYKVGRRTIRKCVRLHSGTVSLEKRAPDRSRRIYGTEELNAQIEKNANALLKDAAKKFNSSITGVFYALERGKNTLEKTIY